MRTRHMMVGLVAFTVFATVVAAQTGGVEDTARAVRSFVERVAGGIDFAASPGKDGVRTGQSATDYRWSGRMDAGETLEIKGVNGSIRMRPGEGDEVVVTAEARSRRSDVSSVRIERVEHDGGLTFCAVYPTPRGKAENRCAPGSEGRMSTERNDVRVDFSVDVPTGVHAIGVTVNGDVEAFGLGADVTAKTVNGDVEVTTAGFARGQTVNGSVDMVMGRAALGAGAEFSTVNGSITLDVPDDIDADVEASWLNGGFESDIPFLLEGKMSRRRASGALGAGGPLLKLKTVNGSIRIR